MSRSWGNLKGVEAHAFLPGSLWSGWRIKTDADHCGRIQLMSSQDSGNTSYPRLLTPDSFLEQMGFNLSLEV